MGRNRERLGLCLILCLDLEIYREDGLGMRYIYKKKQDAIFACRRCGIDVCYTIFMYSARKCSDQPPGYNLVRMCSSIWLPKL